MVRFRLDQNNKISKSPSISVYIGKVTPLYGLCMVLVPRSPHRYKDE